MSTSQPTGLELRQLPDSPDARLFVELSSHQTDLTEAKAALGLAIAGAGEDGPLGDAHQFLVGYAAVAYCRTYLHSNVRNPMTDHVSIPKEHADLHARITEYRNRRVAHSQSQLASTFAFVGLDANGGIRPGVIGMTATHNIPTRFLEEWVALADYIAGQLDQLQAEVEARIIQDVSATDIDEVRSWEMWPRAEAFPVSAFTARNSRGRYPTTWTTFWDSTNEA